MPCVECGESAKDKHDGICTGLTYDDEGTARYWCLDCTVDIMEAELDDV